MLSQASKTCLHLPSFAEPGEYSVVICADDNEYAGRTKLLHKFLSNDDATAGDCPDHDRRCRKLVDICGADTAVELMEMGPLTDSAMLRYQAEYADAFAFVFSLYSPTTLEMAQRLHDKVVGAARNRFKPGLVSESQSASASEQVRWGMPVPVFLIGNQDVDLAPPQDMGEEDFSPTKFNDSAKAQMRVLKDRAKELAQEWKCAYFEVDTSKAGEHGVDEAITSIAYFIKAEERPSTASSASLRTPMKPPKQYRIRRLLGRMGRMTSFTS